MAEPIPLPDGTAITNWDDASIEVSAPDGRKMIVARAAAPAAMQQAVGARDQMASGPSAFVPAAAGPGPFANIDPNTPAPGVNIPKPGAAAAQQPAAPAAMPTTQGDAADPMAAATARIEELAAMPQVQAGGGGVRRTTSTTSAPPGAMADALDAQTSIDEASAEQEIAIEDQAASEEKGRAGISDVYAQQGRRIEQAMQDSEADKASFEQRFAAEQEKLIELQKAAKTEIDPKRYWKEKSTGQVILSRIGIALGAFVNARSEGKVANAPLAMIQQAIAQDIDAQIENRNRAERDVGRQAGLLDIVSSKYETDQQRRQAAIILGNELVATQVEGIVQGMQSEQAKARGMQLAAQLRGENAKATQQLMAGLAGSQTVTEQQVPGGAVPTAAARERAALSEAVFGPGASFDHESYVPAAHIVTGEHRAANSKADAVKINEELGAAQGTLRKVEQIKAIAAQPGSSLSPQQRKNAASLYASLKLDAKRLVLKEAIDAKTGDMLEGLIGPNPTDITSIGNSLDQYANTIRSGVRDQIRNRTHAIDPTTVPLAARAGGMGQGTRAARPQTRPLVAEDDQ